MYPDPYNQNGGTPAPTPQPNANGMYDVVPPLPAGANTGHSGHNPYEFIVAPAQKKHRPFVMSLGGNMSFAKRIGLIVGGALLCMMVIALVLSAFAPKNNNLGLVGIAQRQQEILRLASQASAQAVSTDTKNFMASVSLVISSDQQATISYAQTHGTKKIPTKTLDAKKDTKIDSLLTDAATAGTYDRIAVDTITSQLQTYEATLQTSYKQAKSNNAKKLLRSSFANAALLLKQAKSLTAQ